MKRNVLMVILFLSITIGGLGWLCSQAYMYNTGKLKTSYLTNWKTPTHYDNGYVNFVENIKTYAENIAGNCMPFYEKVLVSDKDMNFAMDYKLYSHLFGDMEQWYVPIGKDDYDYKFVSGNMSTLINAYRVKNKDIEPNLKATEEFFGKLRDSNDVNLFVYGCNVYDTSSLPKDSNLGIDNRKQYIEKFSKSMESIGVSFDYLKYDN
ncbi:MAG: hypothetical protein PHE51_10820, partial [Eubacteriales bacterium]|nr:hypothetical protein [Eubacteriales bacterium]